MTDQNYTLSQYLQSQVDPVQAGRDPFQVAQAQWQAQQPQTLTEVAPDNLEALQGAPMDFEGLAKKFQLSTQGLHAHPELGRLQLLSRIQEKFGPGYMGRPEVQQLLKAFGSQRSSWDKWAEQDSRVSTAQADRTLKALLGGN